MSLPPRAATRPGPASAATLRVVLMSLLPALAPLAAAAERVREPVGTHAVQGAGIGVDSVMSAQTRQLVDWIALTGDHAGAAFIVVDKKRARLLVFDADARLRAHSAVLLGLALGDDSVPGIGSRPMAEILPAERTTPAGRFVAERGRNMQDEDIVWVDYEAAVSMHRVRSSNRVEQRAERLATTSIDDNRISYGCINVPAAFFESHIQPIFALRKAIVYVLPESRPVEEVFGLVPAVSTGLDARRGAPVQQHGWVGGPGQRPPR